MAGYGRTNSDNPSCIWWEGRLLVGRSKNTVGNYVYQFGNLILPLLAMSFLSHAMEAKEFGYFVISQILIAYANVITDYGSQISVVKEGIILRSNLKYKNSVFLNAVFITKIILFGISSSLLLPFIFFYLPMQSPIHIIIIIFLTNAINPSWLFMMIEEMLVFGLINFISKILSIYLIFIYGDSVSLSHALSIFLWGNVFLIFGSYIYLIIYKRKHISIVFNRSVMDGAFYRLKSDWPIFKTVAYGSLLSNSGSIILASYADPRVVGGYTMIEKIARGATFGVAPLLQARIKLSAAQFSSYEDLSLDKIAKLSIIPLAFSLCISLFLCGLYLSGILNRFFPENIVEFSDNLLIFAVWIPISVLNNILGIQLLNNIGEGKYYSNSFLIAAVLTIAMFFIIPRLDTHFGISIAILIGESMLSVLLIKKVLYILKKEEK